MSDERPDGWNTEEARDFLRERTDSGDVLAAVQLMSLTIRVGPKEDILTATDRLEELVDADAALRLLGLVALVRPLSQEELADAADLENDTVNTSGQTVVQPPTFTNAHYEDVCTRAAEAGNPLSMTVLGGLHWGRGRRAEARSWLERAADAGFAGAAFLLGRCALEHEADAETWYRRAAESGHTGAAYSLGSLFLDEDRIGEAEEWLHAAAGRGHLRALHTMGILRANAELWAEAELWIREAAWTGYVPAMAHLGFVLQKLGRLREAYTWSRRAAEAGDLAAMRNAGVIAWHEGRMDDALTWLRRAAGAGNAEAADSLDALLRQLNRSEQPGDADPE